MCILIAVIIKVRTGILYSDHTTDLEKVCVALTGTVVGQGCCTL